ncbi:Uncharacterised protein [Vibrio cholerae]|nr:Uncharacterised protein [Vibrio cholerae]
MFADYKEAWSPVMGGEHRQPNRSDCRQLLPR